MKKFFILSIFYCLFVSSALAQDSRPGVRWWWLGSAVTPEGLTWNMEQMASHGIGTVEITPLYGVQGNDKNNIPFLSPQWMEMLGHCISEGRRLGIEVDMNLGTGWPFGGPTTPIDEAACKYIVVDSIISVPKGFRVSDGYKQILPAPAKEQKFASLILQKTYKTKQKNKVRVIALYQSRTRQKVKRAAPGGEGYVIDHLDSAAVAHYLQKFDKAFEQLGATGQHSGDNKATLPVTFFNDSYEVYGANWTPSLLREFKARRGYALEDKLQEFVDGDTQVVSDYRETISDLLLKNFTEQWVAWSHKHGVLVRNQAHGSPANLIDVYAAVDIPEIEGFGLSEFDIKGLRKDPGYTKKNFSDLSMLKYASSAAHITGKRYTSSETFTWLTEHFRTSLSQMKPDLDLMFCSGVNRMFFHGACYSPKDDAWPGWRFYASVDMSPTNTIWRDAPELTKYIDFCQTRLQQGKPDNDFLVLLPVRNMWQKDTKNPLMMFDIHSMDKKAPEFIQSILAIDSLGYDCDYISEKYLLTTQFVDGMLQTAAGTRYAALVLPGNDCIMTPEVIEHIANLRSQGASVIEGIDGDAMAKVAQSEEIRTRLHLKMIRRITDNGYQYFISNLTPEDIDEDVKLAATGKTVHLTLHSGESCFVDIRTAKNAKPQITYPLNHSSKPLPLTPLQRGEKYASLGNMGWTLHFTESQPAVEGTFNLDGLMPWHNGIPSATAQQNDSIKVLMGTGIYETTFTIDSAPSASTVGKSVESMTQIDLGDVRESARVYINGIYVGTSWCVPYVLSFPSSLLRNGSNTLRIEVTNLPANRIADYDRKGIKWRKFNEINVVDLNYKRDLYDTWAPVPSGLNSSVTIMK